MDIATTKENRYMKMVTNSGGISQQTNHSGLSQRQSAEMVLMRLLVLASGVLSRTEY